MLQLSFKRVKSGQVDKLRAWMRELMDRRDEVIESFEQEEVRQETAWLLEDGQGYIFVYAIEAEDLEKAREIYRKAPKQGARRRVVAGLFERVGSPPAVFIETRRLEDMRPKSTVPDIVFLEREGLCCA